MKLLRIPDANLGGESSSQPAVQADAAQSVSANTVIDTSVDAKKPEFNPQGIAAQIKAKYGIGQEGADKGAASQADAKVDAKAAADASLVQKSNQTEEGEKEKPVTDAQKKSDASAVTDDKLPFHNHPRFKQVIEERNRFEQEVSEYKPAAERMKVVEKFCQDNGVLAQDYDDSIRLAALMRNEPAKALEKLEKIVSSLREQTGAALPIDLQVQVDDGKLSLTHAQEMAKLRIDAANAMKQTKVTQESALARAQQQLVSSLDAWTAGKIKSDPSFKPKQQGQEDGKYELVTDKFLSMWQQQPPQSVDAAVALCEKAYKSVHDFIEHNLPRPQVRRPLASKAPEQQRDKPVDISKPGWAKEVAKRTLANAN